MAVFSTNEVNDQRRDMPALVSASPTSPANADEEAEILAEMNQDEETEEDEAFVVS
jgi:hypothetical protein